jgi:HD-like signal output (HDOD) protein
MPETDLRTEYQGRLLAVKELPSLPAVLDEVNALVENPNSSTEQISKVITKDQVLSAKVLKMVNSPIYGFPGRISSIQHALVLLGFNVIRGIIISTTVFDAMNTAMVGLWEHSQGCAIASSTVSRIIGCKDPEEYAVAGLLHDIGKVVVAVQMPEAKQSIDELVRQEDLRYIQAEQRVLGFAHDRVNLWMCNHWNLPPNLKEALAYHHKPMSASLYPKMAQVVHLADFLTRLYEVGSGGDDQVSVLDPQVLRALGITAGAWEELLRQVEEAFAEL